tara:strand:- start:250 stop:2106 length:1857 start_codon:yes stop_codon:yes gene_type:complete
VNYRPEIDGMRAFAVLPVIFFHAGFSFFEGGFVGVDIFFVISGYLITSIILKEISEKKFNLINFYERRARRILPALFFVMLICIPFSYIWLTPDNYKDFGQSLVAVSLFSSNFLFWVESGYFDAAAELKPLLHTWSLAVEEQYYILFPLYMLFFWRYGIKRNILFLSIIFLVSIILSQRGSYYTPHPFFYLLPSRGWEILMGVFISIYLSIKSSPKSLLLNQIFSILGFLFIVISIFTFDTFTPHPSLFTLLPTLGTVLIIFSAIPGTIMYQLLSSKPLVFIGLISYSSYLWHQPLLSFAKHRILGDPSNFLLMIMCFLSFIMGYFSWRFIEKPFRNKNKFSRNTIFLFSFIGLLTFSIIGSIIHLRYPVSRGIFDTEKIEQLSKLRLERDLINDNDCHNNQSSGFQFQDKCYLDYKTLIFGDSHAADVASSLSLSGFSNFSRITGGGCSLLPSKNRKDCEINFEAFMDGYQKNIYDTIVLISRYSNAELTLKHLESVLEFWGQFDKTNIIILSPRHEFPYSQDFIRIKGGDQYNIIDNSKEEVFFQILSNLKIPNNVKIYKNSDIICSLDKNNSFNSQLCFFSKNGIMYYSDSHHFSKTGFEVFGKRYSEFLSLYIN